LTVTQPRRAAHLHFVQADRLDRLVEHDLRLGDLMAIGVERASTMSRTATEPYSWPVFDA
jgi:hypothetical protein